MASPAASVVGLLFAGRTDFLAVVNSVFGISTAAHSSGIVESKRESGRLRFLTAGERKAMIHSCKLLRAELEKRAGSGDAEYDSLFLRYQQQKQEIRESAAVVIQKHVRGYLVRRPRKAPSDIAAPLEAALRSLSEQRAKAGRVLPYEKWSLSVLLEDKKCIKQILTAHQTMLQRKLSRVPTKEDKSVLRPLYRQYKEIKGLIESAQRSSPLQLNYDLNLLSSPTNGMGAGAASQSAQVSSDRSDRSDRSSSSAGFGSLPAAASAASGAAAGRSAQPQARVEKRSVRTAF